jgi:hypothetical protein
LERWHKLTMGDLSSFIQGHLFEDQLLGIHHRHI